MYYISKRRGLSSNSVSRYKNTDSRITAASPGIPKNPTISALSGLSATETTLNSGNKQKITPPQSVFIRILLIPFVLSRKTQPSRITSRSPIKKETAISNIFIYKINIRTSPELFFYNFFICAELFYIAWKYHFYNSVARRILWQCRDLSVL